MTETLVGYVLVDSGQLMIIDPCYVLDDNSGDAGYENVCEVTLQRHHGEWNGGFVTRTMWGDGSYPVYAELVGDKIKRIIVDFDEEVEQDEQHWHDDDDEETN